jgi:hypothetical protein
MSLRVLTKLPNSNIYIELLETTTCSQCLIVIFSSSFRAVILSKKWSELISHYSTNNSMQLMPDRDFLLVISCCQPQQEVIWAYFTLLNKPQHAVNAWSWFSPRPFVLPASARSDLCLYRITQQTTACSRCLIVIFSSSFRAVSLSKKWSELISHYSRNHSMHFMPDRDFLHILSCLQPQKDVIWGYITLLNKPQHAVNAWSWFSPRPFVLAASARSELSLYQITQQTTACS